MRNNTLTAIRDKNVKMELPLLVIHFPYFPERSCFIENKCQNFEFFETIKIFLQKITIS